MGMGSLSYYLPFLFNDNLVLSLHDKQSQSLTVPSLAGMTVEGLSAG
jgi:hypothetical protein